MSKQADTFLLFFAIWIIQAHAPDNNNFREYKAKFIIFKLKTVFFNNSPLLLLPPR